MKLRNKKTMEIGNIFNSLLDGKLYVRVGNLESESKPEYYMYNSLAELEEEWEDYEYENIKSAKGEK